MSRANGSPAVGAELMSIMTGRRGEVAGAERARAVYEAIDRLDAKYGKHTMFLGSR